MARSSTLFAPWMLAALLAGLPARADGTAPPRAHPHHSLRLELDPAAHRLRVHDVLTLPLGARPAFLLLHAGLDVTRSVPPLVRAEPEASMLAVLGVPEGEPSDVPLVAWRLPRGFAGGLVELDYEGVLHHALPAEGVESARAFRTTPGFIGPEGVFLAGSSVWVPVAGPGLVTFDLVAQGPEGWHLIAAGGGTSRGVDGLARWESGDAAVDEIHVVGGPLVRYEDRAGPTRAEVYLHEQDDGLAGRYLEASGRYLAMYDGLIGRHPWPKFALVENFWETGWGMPSFTLLGRTVIRLPFIITSSYPHEILHDWWGNGVYVAPGTGNWCEGLTAYLADHLLQEQRGAGAEHRRATLQKYRDFVRGGRDFSLADFRSRHDGATEAVGYGKSLMGFHALRRHLGDDRFRRTLQRFFRDHRFERATFADFRAAAEAVSGEDLGWFFTPWVERVGAPELLVLEVSVLEDGGRFTVHGRIEQRQVQAPFELDLPIVVQLAEGVQALTLHLSARRTPFRIECAAAPLALHVDPAFDVFRRLDPRETPATLSRLFGDPALLALVPGQASVAEVEALTALARSWSAPARDVEVKSDAEVTTLPSDRAVVLLGRSNLHAPALFPDESAALAARATWVLGTDVVPAADHSVALVRGHPGDAQRAVAWVVADPPGASPGLARKLPHYGKYASLAFRGQEPTNVVKGLGRATESPLRVDLRPAAGRATALPPLVLPADPILAPLPAVFSAARLASHVAWLAAPEREGRGVGTAGLTEAERWLAERFAEVGLRPGGDEGTYFQRLDVPGPGGKTVRVANVIGVLPGARTDWAGQAVVLGAHLDHLGLGWPDVRSGEEGRLHPGADDNASGVAVMLEVTRALAGGGPPPRTLVVVGFAAEESGRLGSRAFVERRRAADFGDIRAAVVLDAVGRLEGRPVTVIGAESATEWPHVARGVGFTTGALSVLAQEGLGASDHQSFLEAGLPAIQLFSGVHLDYHRPTDTADRVDVNGLVQVATFTKETLGYLLERPEPLTVTLAGSPPAPAAGAASRRVSFGSVPDFAFAGPGVRLTGVVPGSPAEAAGLREGDVLTHLDGRGLADLRAFSAELKDLAPGAVVKATVRRGAGVLEVDVTLTAR